jgi:ribonuclease Z
MDLSLAFLGTGGSVPSARRATACLLLRRGGERLLFDCGEGAQRQMIRSTGLVQLDSIYITHYHADHYLGLPGLIKTYDLQSRERPLRVLGPPGLKGLFKALSRIVGRTGFEVDLIEIGEGEAVPAEGYEVRSFPIDHRVRGYGYALVEEGRPGHIDVKRAAELGIGEGPDLGRLQRGETVQGSGGPVEPAEVMGEARAGRRVVITGDTAPCDTTREAAARAQLLVHDGSFAVAEAGRAVETGHSTARAAAELASDAGVAMLAIVHVSSRYNVGAILDEARAVHPGAVAPRDFDLVEIPFPERGEPRLIPNGAKREHEGPESGSELVGTAPESGEPTRERRDYPPGD